MKANWIPLWLLKDEIATLEDRLRRLIQKDNTKLEPLDISITDDDDGTIKFYLRGYSKSKKDYAFAQQAITKKLIEQTRYSPTELKTTFKPKSAEEMAMKILDLLDNKRRRQ